MMTAAVIWERSGDRRVWVAGASGGQMLTVAMTGRAASVPAALDAGAGPGGAASRAAPARGARSAVVDELPHMLGQPGASHGKGR